MNQNLSFKESLSEWLLARCLGKRPRTQEFYRDVFNIMLRAWPKADVPTADICADMVLTFAQSVAHHCPSRWNTIVAALRYITPHGQKVPRRRLNIRQFTPPTQAQFAALLAECDRMPRTKAGLVIRFLSFTGLRISEARALTWSNVAVDQIYVPAEVTKSGKARAVPLLPGLQEVLDRLRALDSAGYVLPRQNPRKAIEQASRRTFGVQWSFHCFRHLFATRCIESLVDLPTVARWLGHQDGGALLARTYFHLVDAHSQAMAAKVRI